MIALDKKLIILPETDPFPVYLVILLLFGLFKLPKIFEDQQYAFIMPY